MNELFIQPIEFEKVSYKRISENPAEWTGNIMEAFYNQFPYFANTPVSVHLTQKDEAKGYAIGQINVEEGMGMVVPIIIQSHELYPFDVCIIGGSIMPLTESTLNMYVQGRSAFLKIVKPETGDITNTLFNTSFSQQIVPNYVTESYKQSSLREDSAIELLKSKLSTKAQAKSTSSAMLMGKALGMGHSMLTGSDPRAAVTAGTTMGAALTNVQKFDLKEDAILDRTYKAVLLGGEAKANEVFHDLKEKYNMGDHDCYLYMMLQFKRWADQQGFNTKIWDIPGFEKTADKKFDAAVDEAFKKHLAGISNPTKEQKDAAFFNVMKDLSADNGPTTVLRDGKHVNIESIGYKKVAMEEDEETKKHEKSESKKYEKAEDKREEKKDKKEDEKEKKASILESILPTISQQMKDSFFDEFTKNASLVEGFKRNGTSSLILKVASAQPERVDFKEKVRKELDRDIHYMYKSGSHEYTAIFGSSKVDDPVEVKLDAISASKLPAIKTSAVHDVPQEKLASANGFITTVSGRRFITLENNEFVEVDPQVKIAAEKFKNNFEINKPGIAKAAMWIMGEGAYSDPFEVTRVWSSGNRGMVETFNGLEKKSYVRLKGIDSEYVENNITYIPDTYEFVKLGTRVDLPKERIDIWANGNEVLRTDSGAYALKGNTFSEFNKTASKITDVHKAIWTVLQLGGTQDDVEKIASLNIGKSYVIPHALTMPLSFDKVAEQYNKAYADAARRISTIAKDFVKEASVLNDVPTVDAVLSLNFINKNNIQEFAQALPSLGDAAQKLSDMLLKTRLGVRIADETVIRRVMLGLLEIIDVLTGVSNLSIR